MIDLSTRMVVGWQLADHMRTTLIIDALAVARGSGHLQRSVDPAELPVSTATLASLLDCLRVAGLESGCSQDEMLAAGVRAAGALARDLPDHVRSTLPCGCRAAFPMSRSAFG